jgi:hypothetical protein
MRFAATIPLMLSATLTLPAHAQAPSADDSLPAPTDPAPPTASGGGRQVYGPADFAQFAPKNAADMVRQVPGFQIRDNENQRGLGQATGNVLFNGQRPSTKGDSLFTLLSRIPADNVDRVEIVDGASLDIPGLSGQVANVVYRSSEGVTGQFRWMGEARAYYADPLFTRAGISLSGKTGELEYELGLDNTNAGRSSAGGETLILNGAGSVIEVRDDVWRSRFDAPKASAKLTWARPGGDVGHLNGHYQRQYFRYDEIGERTSPAQPDTLRVVTDRNDTWNYEVGGDYEFALGPGRMKTIGLRRFSHEPFSQTVVTTFADGAAATGDRFQQTGDLGETIARAEYSWKMLGGDWQMSGEGAFNTLDNVAGLFTLHPSGDFVEVPFPGGSGGVSEDRYEGLLSFGRKLTDKFSVQITGGAEHSTIMQTGPGGLTRSFFRPKGSLSLSWTPSATLDMSLKIRRRVLQLSFYDFLARAFLNDSNQNASNADLRPQQDWSYEGEINKKLGAWGSQQFRFIYRNVEDKVEIIPLSGGGEAIGNIDKSWAAAIVSTSTIKFDPLGLRGVKLDGTIVLQTSRLRDPFTGLKRQWNGFVDRQAFATLRHDIPDSDWAWGAEASYNRVLPRYRSNSVDRIWEGPTFATLFLENKDIAGLTVRGEVGNILGARSYRDRTVWTGLRDQSPVAFVEQRDRRIGPIFRLSVSGNV